MLKQKDQVNVFNAHLDIIQNKVLLYVVDVDGDTLQVMVLPFVIEKTHK